MKKTELKEIIRKIIKEEYPKSVNSPNWTSTTTGNKTSSSNKPIPKAKGNFEEPNDENLKKYGLDPKKVKINSDGSIDYNGDVRLSAKNLKHIPFQFNKVSGNFNCEYNELISLQGSPKEVGGTFSCFVNHKLISLQYAPQKVGGDFSCSNNYALKSLRYSPKEVGGDFICHDIYLESLRYSPQKVGGGFYCYNNILSSLQFAPKVVGGDFVCYGNKTKFTEEDVRKVSNVKGIITVSRK